ncbi:MAG: sigma-70 family RNA polymerase sigma factor [Gemmatimonadetes bacterium]|nr:sigma-70 family RNA polymerase sigma factor [Gemmatimonadota bacterium]NIW76025.1 sigma-70 family RNA polymerase sigma factor [Gemmatimonadota bacterium]NIY35977.1 sigma-70 family RNA polymerase sigma factor [Gemmatimonadota bacterium]
MDNVSDGELVVWARRGDGEAFGALVRRYLRPALAVAWEFAPSRDGAEDLVQDAFHRALRALPSFDESRPFRPWFFTILRNLGRNAAEREARWSTGPVSEGLRADGADPEEEAHRADVRDRIRRGLDLLPPMQRACFRLCDMEGFDGVEVAEMLDLSAATVRVHRHRARAALRDALRDLNDTEEEEEEK